MQHEPQALVSFKQQLGIHPSEDEDFGWIAEVGLQSPLPPRWTSHTDPSTGFVYYVDHDRQASNWENPLVPFLRRVVEIGRQYLASPTEGFFEEQKGILWHQHKHELDAWHGPFVDAQGRQYFVNSSEGVSSWQDPRVDAQYLFELESGLIGSLAELLPAPVPDTPGWASDDPWRTDSGAEVLTIGDAGQALQGPPLARCTTGQRLQARMANAARTIQEEHKSSLDKVCATVERVKQLQQDEQEAQRLHFHRKVEARRQRSLARERSAAAAANAAPLPAGRPPAAAGDNLKSLPGPLLPSVPPPPAGAVDRLPNRKPTLPPDPRLPASPAGSKVSAFQPSDFADLDLSHGSTGGGLMQLLEENKGSISAAHAQAMAAPTGDGSSNLRERSPTTATLC